MGKGKDLVQRTRRKSTEQEKAERKRFRDAKKAKEQRAKARAGHERLFGAASAQSNPSSASKGSIAKQQNSNTTTNGAPGGTMAGEAVPEQSRTEARGGTEGVSEALEADGCNGNSHNSEEPLVELEVPPRIQGTIGDPGPVVADVD